ncbi:MAG: E22 family MetX-like putative esterase [Burkholderiaceae bacterium]
MYAQREVFTLDHYTTTSGKALRNVRIGYETYGKLNAAKDNVILVCHFFSGTAHAAGKYSDADLLPGWWDAAIGPGKALDTDRYFIVSSDSLVNLVVGDGLTVTTGPASINPDTGRPYGCDFPIVTVTDFVRVQKKLLEHLGIDRLVAVAGPSGGSVQAIEWSVEYPECVPRVVAVISPGLTLHPYAAAMVECWARPIMLDPAWKNGYYDPTEPPRKGLIEALRLTTLTALSYEVLETQFGYGPADPAKDPSLSLANEFKADAMLEKFAADRAQVTDANHFLYMVRACKLYNAQSRIHLSRAKYLFLPAETDLIFPPKLAEQAVCTLNAAGRKAELFVLRGSGGHMDGLTQIAQARNVINDFLIE